MTIIPGLMLNESGFIEKVIHSDSMTPTSFTPKSPKIEWDDAGSDVTMTLNTDAATRSAVFSTRASRPRISNNRTRPYQDNSRTSSHRRTAPPCRYFQAGRCINGDTCRYQHVVRSASPESDLDRQLSAFVKGEDASSPDTTDNDLPSPTLPKSTPKVSYNPDDFPDEEELYEVVSHPTSTISEVRFNTRSNPAELRTYFVAQRQPVMEYEGNNVGILSGGVLLGIPNGSCPATSNPKTRASIEDTTEFEMVNSPSPSPVSNDSDHELWKGPVRFEDSAMTEAENLIWTDDEADEISTEAIDSDFGAYNFALASELPSPPPIIRRIIRQFDGHNRRHSLS
ncbi:unnamed protein product [Rhizoctonia solani]|uniref:C3H1-type domain-containing protein n=1 Tax=Rhizoctonia solani TaxID=456999 RepID=A0A8H2WT97_9AGAM|nr:uncharacterized protein RhiXN_02575 [Rhizoctonia solani]QRW17651.1 hypothetical protein RhiXN_02575 [Rhizoctonia solani]CAE6401424.1 unnamed protein product [Rhizoctonia solani]